ncbi:type 1 glutamine amidotransferase [Metallosphaera hakonensis]|uniref:type 1 glutamine amidotransferase n=1 Tax=Metallosphaera hakonensis TaxID=79601 RepID=UPI0006D29D25|nr:type 1 glutamine amidotransferase [Metallosphaera hakonensis]
MLAILNHRLEGLGTLKSVFEDMGIKVTEKMATELSGRETFDGLIIMGGPMGVYQMDKYPFLRIETKLIRDAIEMGKPVLGICLGAQLISASMGGEVRKGTFGEEIGVKRVTFLKDLGVGNSAEVFHWHGDTFSLPAGATLLAYSDKYFQGFQMGSTMGLQFHVEVDSRMIREWIREYGGDTKLVDEVSEREERFRIVEDKLMHAWIDSLKG